MLRHAVIFSQLYSSVSETRDIGLSASAPESCWRRGVADAGVMTLLQKLNIPSEDVVQAGGACPRDKPTCLQTSPKCREILPPGELSKSPVVPSAVTTP